MDTIRFRHATFTARFPVAYRYAPSHFWMAPGDETGPDGLRTWRVGFTKFATRMLGELVELTLDVAAGGQVAPGDRLGTVEGFKAVSDLFCVMDGRFAGGNEALGGGGCLTHSDPYGQGWLYAVRGEPEPGHLDVHGYVALLTETIDRLQASRYSGDASEPASPEDDEP